MESIKKTVFVDAPAEVAFRTFTEGMTTWWPLHSHKIGKVPAVAAGVEARPGGRWYERGSDGTECDWGKVLVWEPPNRLVLAWQITPLWQFDASVLTEVEVKFVTETPARTRVELEHRHLDQFGDKAAEMFGIFNSEMGWAGILTGYGRQVAAGG